MIQPEATVPLPARTQRRVSELWRQPLGMKTHTALTESN